MLKRYAHIKTAYLSKKINKVKKERFRQDYFIPYPARIEILSNGSISISFLDFENLSLVGYVVDSLKQEASVALLKEIARRMKGGDAIPYPSDVNKNKSNYLNISPV